jgi:predicted alpha-1,6-mannanase (GH76 family)
MAYGMITNGEPGDEVWVDRTFNGGLTWSNETRTGDVQIPPNSTEALTPMFNLDDPSTLRIGALRVCAVVGGQSDQTCTPWARSTVNAANKLDAAVTAMMMYYEAWRGLWKTVGWWNGANDMTVLIDYQLLTGSHLYEFAINNTFELNKGLNEFGGYNFTSDSIDDSLWWGLAWVKAFDLTGDQKYLNMAAVIADYCYQFHDDVCGGGIWWSDRRQYKNAIPNEQYIKLSIQLYNRNGDRKYLTQSVNLWNWFRNSGMINEENLINDGLHECRNNGQETWTYNQGVILGGLVELYQATGNMTYLTEARKIADAVIRSTHLNDEYGILWEPCFASEPDCGPNAPCFKGIFIRNLAELDRVLENRPYTPYILKQAESIYEKNRNPLDQYGLKWSGPLDFPDASRQQSAVDALLAAEMASRK